MNTTGVKGKQGKLMGERDLEKGVCCYWGRRLVVS